MLLWLSATWQYSTVQHCEVRLCFEGCSRTSIVLKDWSTCPRNCNTRLSHQIELLLGLETKSFFAKFLFTKGCSTKPIWCVAVSFAGTHMSLVVLTRPHILGQQLQSLSKEHVWHM